MPHLPEPGPSYRLHRRAEPDDDAVDDDTTPSDDDSPGDADQDGYLSPEDCDDATASLHPYAWEAEDAMDHDCEGWIDEADTDPVSYLALSDNTSTLVFFSGHSFPFCDTTWTSAYVISNGRVTARGIPGKSPHFSESFSPARGRGFKPSSSPEPQPPRPPPPTPLPKQTAPRADRKTPSLPRPPREGG